MSNLYFHQVTFNRNHVPVANEYDACIFIGCDGTGLDLTGYQFVTCRFEECNGSLAKLQPTVLSDVRFIE